MTNLPLRLSLALPLLTALGCDTKASSVSATASESGGDGSGDGSGSASGTSTSDPSGGSTGGDDPIGNCVETPTVIGLDTQSSDGAVPSEVLAAVEGTYTGTFSWGLQEGPAIYTGSTDPTPVQITVSYDGGEIRDVEAELVTPCEHDGPCPCSGRLEIDATMHIASDDGVLDETWTVTLNHVESSDEWGFDPPGTSIYHGFDPDQTQGALGTASFELDEGVVLEQLIATMQLGDGAVSGGFLVEVSSDMGWVGAGSAASFAAVTEVTEQACAALSGATSCEYAGCTPASGQPLFGSPEVGCQCSEPRAYCFAAPLQGDPTPTLYTRLFDDGFEVSDEVVVFDTLFDPAGTPWRLCSDAPEVNNCACFDGAGTC